MAAHPRQRPGRPQGRRKLRVEEARFYAGVYSSARKGCVSELLRKGCSEEEAEDIFSTALEKVMETVDPIAREFSAAQMVNFIKQTCWRCLVDERRRRGLRTEVTLSAVGSLSDAGAETPAEAAEEREAAAIGREALQMLPERDRVVFRQRHQMDLSPEEILQNTPGLSLRSYRRIIHRANALVLDAFDRIESGERCKEMESGLLRRYVSEESSGAERRAVEAHLVHCPACQRARAQMRDYLADVASGLLAASTLAGSGHVDALGNVVVRFVGHVFDRAQVVGQLSRAARERAREALFRTLGGLPGTGESATVGQMLTAPSVKVASVCAAGLTAGVCVAAGVVPGIGAGGVLGHHHHQARHRATPTSHPVAPTVQAPAVTATPSAPGAAATASETASEDHRRKRAKAEPGKTAERTSSSARATPPASSSPSSARVSGRQTGTEFGPESSQPAPSTSSPAPSSSPSTSSGSSGSSSSESSSAQSGQGSSSKSSGSGSEFGL
jgi:RNA polymerase sigma factor (sigma-70 family)